HTQFAWFIGEVLIKAADGFRDSNPHEAIRFAAQDISLNEKDVLLISFNISGSHIARFWKYVKAHQPADCSWRLLKYGWIPPRIKSGCTLKLVQAEEWITHPTYPCLRNRVPEKWIAVKRENGEEIEDPNGIEMQERWDWFEIPVP